MDIVFLNPRQGKTFTLQSGSLLGKCLLTALVLTPMVLGVAGYHLAQRLHDPVFSDAVAERWHRQVNSQQQTLVELKQEATDQVRAITMRMAEMQAQLIRLDALGERLADDVGIHSDEFQFGQPPAMGGPHGTDEQGYLQLNVIDAMDDLSTDIEKHEAQLQVLNRVLAGKQLEQEVFLAGRPIKKGWLSSRYGQRNDPFSGKLAMHKGVDFAGKEGSDVISTASGVVTWSGERYGYGLLVEINHGEGFTTRYGHAKELLVEQGQIVRTGQQIAKMGSSGRSTGPHVHYEVLKNGRQIDPANYIHRRRR